MANDDHIRSAASCADILTNNPSPDDKSPLVSYLTRKPDELSMHCLALTKAALDSDDMMYREVLLFALIERQICLAKELDALADNQLSGVDDRLDKLIKQYYQQDEECDLLAPPTEPLTLNAVSHEWLIECCLSNLPSRAAAPFCS